MGQCQNNSATGQGRRGVNDVMSEDSKTARSNANGSLRSATHSLMVSGIAVTDAGLGYLLSIRFTIAVAASLS